MRNYYAKTTEQRREHQRLFWSNMIKNPDIKLRYALRRRMSTALRNAMLSKKESSARIMDYIGCSIIELRAYLEAQFKPGMTWSNHGNAGWHIDHVMPLSGFDLTNKEDTKKAWHYTNLRPLWAKENLRKHNKKPTTHQPLLMLLNP